MRTEIRSRLSDAFSSLSAPESAIDSGAPTKPLERFAEIGTSYDLTGLNFVIDGFEEKTTLNQPYDSPVKAPDGVKFVLVNLKITNSGAEQYTFFVDHFFRLADAQGRRFNMSEHWQDVKTYLNVSDLGPGVPKSGIVVYEVPNDSSGYFLEECRPD